MPSSATPSVPTRPEDLTAVLTSIPADVAASSGEVQLRAMRELKNQIIGNKAKKLRYLRLGAASRVVAVLASSRSPQLLVQAAAAVGSFACGVEEGALAVVDAGALPLLFQTLFFPDPKVVDAAARALQLIFQSKVVPRYEILEEKNVELLLSLLNSENENLTELAANIISHSCLSSIEQMALCNAKMVCRLLRLLSGSPSQRNAGLDSVTAIIQKNPEMASQFMSLSDGKACTLLVNLMRDKNPRTRLRACHCLIAIGHSAIKTTLVNVLLELVDCPGQTGDEALSALTDLVASNREVWKWALSGNVVEKLCSHLRNTPVHPQRLEGILLLLAELCADSEELRFKLVSLGASDFVVHALKHDKADVRVAACTCVKNILRSLSNLKVGCLSGDSVVINLINLLHDDRIPVQVAALGAIANFSVNVATRKSAVLRFGGALHLTQLSQSMVPDLRLLSLRALRNLAFLLSGPEKRRLLKEMTVPKLSSLICDAEPSVQYQALALISNLVDGDKETIERVLGEDGAILNAISRQLRNSGAVTIVSTQGMLLLANIAAGDTLHKDSVMDVLLPTGYLFKFLQSSDVSLRVVSLWCVLNLLNPDCGGFYSRLTRLRESGVISQIKSLVNDTSLDCKLRVGAVLELCMDSEKT